MNTLRESFYLNDVIDLNHASRWQEVNRKPFKTKFYSHLSLKRGILGNFFLFFGLNQNQSEPKFERAKILPKKFRFCLGRCFKRHLTKISWLKLQLIRKGFEKRDFCRFI
jgi:hypothetical protein